MPANIWCLFILRACKIARSKVGISFPLHSVSGKIEENTNPSWPSHPQCQHLSISKVYMDLYCFQPVSKYCGLGNTYDNTWAWSGKHPHCMGAADVDAQDLHLQWFLSPFVDEAVGNDSTCFLLQKDKSMPSSVRGGSIASDECSYIIACMMWQVWCVQCDVISLMWASSSAFS